MLIAFIQDEILLRFPYVAAAQGVRGAPLGMRYPDDWQELSCILHKLGYNCEVDDAAFQQALLQKEVDDKVRHLECIRKHREQEEALATAVALLGDEDEGW